MFIKKIIDSKEKLVVGLNELEMAIFLQKFNGVFIFNGKKSLSKKYFDQILQKFKEIFNNDPLISLKDSIDNLVPLLGCAFKKVGKRVDVIPSAIYGNRRFVLMLTWIVRNLKRKSNIFGVKLADVINGLLDEKKKRGKIMQYKKDFYRKALAGRYLIGKKKSRRLRYKDLRTSKKFFVKKKLIKKVKNKKQ